MKQQFLARKSGLALALGMVGLAGLLPLRGQNNAAEKTDEPVAVEQPVESPARSAESDEEENPHDHHGKDVVMFGNDFVLKEDEVADDVVIISGNATINGRVARDLVVVAGSAKVLGKVDGEMAVVLGSATLGP